MTLKEALFELINEEVVIEFDERNNKIEITELHEGKGDYKPNSRDKFLHSVSIVGIKKEEFIIAFKPDSDKKELKFLSGLINDKVRNIKKSCDGIVFCKINNQYYILAVELKSEKPKDLNKKYKAVKLFLTFLNEILKMYYDIEEKFIIVNVLFDRNPKKGKPNFLPIPSQREEHTQIYFQQGFDKTEGNESRIRRILDAINEEIKGSDDITYLNY